LQIVKTVLFLKNNIPSILVTGAGGQLGNELKAIAASYPDYKFLFVSRQQLPIDDFDAVTLFFKGNNIAYCINCAAYTAVDKAESEKEIAFRINTDAVANLANICRQRAIQFIHISTDYVFDGSATHPYKETDHTNPMGVYGASKCKGEELALQNNPSAIIVRTSWLYSSFGGNFVKTMLRLMKERQSINVVDDQYGCPTYAADLAAAIMQLIASGVNKPGIYNYSNEGITNWYGFAVAIKETTNSSCIINPIPTTQYPTPAKRPAYSVLDTKKIRETFRISIPEWKISLKACLKLLS
jgi:dTDP-4-dehydrorhamnose reductase